MKSQLETERYSTCLLCLKLSGGKNYKEVAAGEVIAVEAVPLPPPAGSFHTETRHTVVFFPAGSHILTAGGWAGSGDPFSTLIRSNSQPLMEAIKQYRSHIIVLDNQDGRTCRSVWSAATPCREI